jgi:hypothetical protein
MNFFYIDLQYKGQASIEQDSMNRLNPYVCVRGSGCSGPERALEAFLTVKSYGKPAPTGFQRVDA